MFNTGQNISTEKCNENFVENIDSQIPYDKTEERG